MMASTCGPSRPNGPEMASVAAGFQERRNRHKQPESVKQRRSRLSCRRIFPPPCLKEACLSTSILDLVPGFGEPSGAERL